MDDPIYKIESEEESDGDDMNENLEESEENDHDLSSNWKINIKEEEQFWETLRQKGFTYEPKICPLCQQGTLEIKKRNALNLINPLYLRCTFKKCRNIKNLRCYSFLKKFRKFPASVTFKILEEFIISGLNATKIKTILEKSYKVSLNVLSIQKVLYFFRQIIYSHMKIKYSKTLIGGFDEEGNAKIVALDESLFVHNSKGEQIWILGGIETKYRRIRLAITKVRNVINLENFVNENFLEGTHFTHDGWAGYSFLNNNINYSHEVHNHGRGQFGFDYSSTAHIENLWANMKKILITIYGIMPQKNFPLFLRECELRYNLIKCTYDEKINIIKDIFKEVYENCKFVFEIIDDI